ncbi:MarR family winged helix-turn-helix transcriptional regulator [Chitinophaga sp. S165]|uniref:MarR family winged helix-turn-helix transcriptional regulator n=1 Tax=Chitinophaga sp. S165 TaxID=2135462 RepID=UPI000D7162BE|nr:MarR family winged helix-turn-helix transcriptional regulator [Chitinophaga sp. S165]PWV54325.1 DNA-binding MarR family transcriptional regulator [Chitinophaga sp. S165]
MKRMADTSVDEKIVEALERISQAVRVLAWKAGTVLQLNPIQMQILVFLLKHEHVNNKITSLAKEFNISKASISDSVNALEQKELICKKYMIEDVRNFNVHLTAKGRNVADEAALYTRDLSASIASLPANDKGQLFSVVGKIIFDLHTRGVIPVQRMCRACKYLETDGEKHYCRLLERALNTDQFQIDCCDHEVATGLINDRD